MKVSEDRSPSAVFQLNLATGLHKYLTAVVIRLGRGFSVSAIINQLLPKYVDTFAAQLAAGDLPKAKEQALRRFEKTEPMVYDHRMPLAVADLIRAKFPEATDKVAFQTLLDDLVLIAVHDFRQNGPLKGREF